MTHSSKGAASMLASEILTNARKKIANKKNWTQEEYARGKSGRVLSPMSKSATCFCSYGAICSVLKLEPKQAEEHAASRYLEVAARECKGWHSVVSINDQTDHPTVLRMFDLAIEKAKASEPPHSARAETAAEAATIIATLTQELAEARLERDEAITNGQDRIADLGAELDQATGFIETHKAENARLLAVNATLRSAAIEACDLLTERRYGSSARSPSHNARLVLEAVIGSTATTPAQAEKLADYWSDWLIDAVGGATQNRALLRGEPTEDKILTEAIVLNGKKAIVSAVNAALAGHEQAGALTPVMQAAENAAKIIEGWSDSKRNYADRIVRRGSTPTMTAEQMREEAASVAYAICAETRHVTLGDRVKTAIRALPASPGKGGGA